MWNIGVKSDLVIVDQNSEMADMSNPRGYIYGEVFFVTAQDKIGNRRVLEGISFKDQNEAERFALTLSEDSPEGADWQEDDPVYGSEAYISNGIEERRCFDERWEEY